MTVSQVKGQGETEPRKAAAAPQGARCHLCGGRLGVLVRVEPQTNGQPVTYYACEQCGHVRIRIT